MKILDRYQYRLDIRYIQPEGQEFGYVLKGSVTIVQEGGRKYKVKAQETFYMDGSKSHYLYNHGAGDAKILWITTPPVF